MTKSAAKALVSSSPLIGDAALERVRQLKAQGVDTLIIGATDLNEQFRTKRFSLDLFLDSEVEVAFSDYVFSADISENLMTPRPGYQGYLPTAADGLPDLQVRPDWSQARVLPWAPQTAVVLGDYLSHDGQELAVSPRGVLRRVVERLQCQGFFPVAAVEFEFLVFRAPPGQAKASPCNLMPLSEGTGYGYGRSAEDERFLGPLRRLLVDAGIPIEAVNPEASPGQVEMTMRYADAQQTADNAVLFKNFVKEILAKDDLTASFIAKYGPEYGSSGHVHFSLRGESGKPLMTDEAGALSDVFTWSVGGVLSTLPEMTALYAPTINAYHRYETDYQFAGSTVAWGIDNRTCGLRAIHTTPSSTRLESRVAGADMNPYLALAGLLAGVGAGLEKQIEAPPAVVGDAYGAPDVGRVPRDLREATELFEKSEVARDWLGDDFVDFYAESRHWEVNEHRKSFSEWELRRYL